MSQDQVRRFIFTIRNTFTAVEQVRVPVIAAINGFAFGGGMELALACDIRIAASTAVLGLTETSLAIIPGAGGTQRLPRLAGRKRALELLLTGDPFTPARALEIGLVNMVVPHEALLATARELAGRIVRHSPLAIGAIITAVTRGLNMSVGEGLQVESEQFAALVPTGDLGEGINAWIERRQPVYRGR